MASSTHDTAGIAGALGALPASTPASEVARRMLDLFIDGSVAPGTRLPAERTLAATLGVGRSAVREALAALEILGIVDVRPGSGTYLRGAASDLLPQTLRWGLLIGENDTSELLEMRSGLEIYVARLAADRADDDELDALSRALERMRAAVDDLGAFADSDRAFHDALGAAAHNALLVDQVTVVRSLLQVYADRAVHTLDDARRAVAEHDLVLRALLARDADAAASAMAVHMTTASARLRDAQGSPRD